MSQQRMELTTPRLGWYTPGTPDLNQYLPVPSARTLENVLALALDWSRNVGPGFPPTPEGSEQARLILSVLHDAGFDAPPYQPEERRRDEEQPPPYTGKKHKVRRTPKPPPSEADLDKALATREKTLLASRYRNRRTMLIVHLRNHERMTYAAIGRQVGISGNRVMQILDQHDKVGLRSAAGAWTADEIGVGVARAPWSHQSRTNG